MKTIALFGYYGVGNLGDEAVVSTLIRNIRARIPEARIVGISLDPSDTRRRHGIDSLPIRRTSVPRELAAQSALVRAAWAVVTTLCMKLPGEILHALSSYRHLRAIDTVVVAGSGGVYDWWHGAWTHPFTHFRWACLCRLSGTRLMYLSVGAGPFKTPMGRWFFRHALSSASYISVRDPESIEWMKAIGVRRAVALYPDMAFDIIPSAGKPARADECQPGGNGRAAARMRVGINALPYYHDEWAPLLEDGGIGYDAYIDALARFADWLIMGGVEPVFFHSQVGDGFLDADIARALDQLRHETQWRAKARFTDCRTPQDLFEEMAGLDIIVASRFHAVLFSYLLRKPAIGISYHHKIDDLMQCMGQSSYALDIRTLSFSKLVRAYSRLEQDLARGRWRVDEQLFAANRTRLGEQFDEVFFPDHAPIKTVNAC